jgi:hypothetical protein
MTLYLTHWTILPPPPPIISLLPTPHHRLLRPYPLSLQHAGVVGRPDSLSASTRVPKPTKSSKWELLECYITPNHI